MKIAGSKVEFLDFDFEILNFFLNHYIILNRAKIQNSAKITLFGIYMWLQKEVFFEAQIKSVGQS